MKKTLAEKCQSLLEGHLVNEDSRSKVEFTGVLLSHLKQELLQKIFIFLNKSTKKEILKRTGDKLQEPFDEETKP